MTDKASGKNLERTGYQALKSTILRNGDTLVIKSLDRQSRNKADIKNELEYFKSEGIRLKVLDLPTTLIDLPKEQNWIFDMINNILIEVLSSIAEQERLTIRQRQREGIDAAKKKGKHLGRASIPYPDKWGEYFILWKKGEITVKEFMSATNLKRTTFYKLLKKYEEATIMKNEENSKKINAIIIGKNKIDAMTIFPKEKIEPVKFMDKSPENNIPLLEADSVSLKEKSSEKEKNSLGDYTGGEYFTDLIENFNEIFEKSPFYKVPVNNSNIKQNDGNIPPIPTNYCTYNHYMDTVGYNPNFNPNRIIKDTFLPPDNNTRRVIPKNKNETNNSKTALHVAELLLCKYPFACVDNGLYYYSGGYYTFLDTDKAYTLIINLGYAEILKKGTIAFVKDVFEFLRHDTRIQISSDKESDRYISFNNGVLDLDKWRFIPPTPKIFTTSKVNCDFHDFVEEPKTPVFDKFIYDCSEGDSNKAKLLMEIIGYYITSDTDGKCFVVLWGPGDTGKSVIGNFLSRIFNSEAVSAVDLNNLGSRFDNYALVGRKINVSMDLPNGLINSTAVSQLKMLTGNDLCKAEAKYLNSFTFRNTCKFFFACNFPVKTKSYDDGFYNRLVQVYMGNVIPKDKQDKKLIDKLIYEAPGIIYKCLKYYLQYKKRNYVFTKVNESTVFSKSMEETLREFINSCCIYLPQSRLFMADLYTRYKVFCIDNNYSYYETQSEFTSSLKKNIDLSLVEIKKIRIGDATKSGIIGLTLSNSIN
ncbi:MAG: phage/plasmid primase, P4 family [Lachnospirales bacterium]